MTEKDLLDSLRFVDDDLIEEAGLEQLKEEKQKNTASDRGGAWRRPCRCLVF